MAVAAVVGCERILTLAMEVYPLEGEKFVSSVVD